MPACRAWCVLPLKACRSFELHDGRVEGTVLMMRRAEQPEPSVSTDLKPLLKCHRQSRLADPRLARQQHNLAFSAFRPLPTPQQQFQLFLPSHQRRKGCLVFRLEPALDGARTRHLPRLEDPSTSPCPGRRTRTSRQ
jgi:hypothetical protein